MQGALFSIGKIFKIQCDNGDHGLSCRVFFCFGFFNLTERISHFRGVSVMSLCHQDLALPASHTDVA